MRTSIFILIIAVFVLILTSVRGQVKVESIPVEKSNLSFATEVEFAKWLSRVQFIQEDSVQLYYHKGYRFKLLPKGKIMRTTASLDHEKRSITWISKTDQDKSVTSVLKIDDAGNAHLKNGEAKAVVLKIQAR